MALYCGICGNEIVTRKYTNRSEHKPNCPLYVTTERLAEIIVEESDRKEKEDA